VSDARGKTLSKISFGCEPLGGADWRDVDIDEIARAIDVALDAGVNCFDTADVYGLGLSEQRLADILGPRRNDVVIATKGGLSWRDNPIGGRAIISRNSSPEHLETAVEGSLRRLRIDCLPIYFVHWPDPSTDIRISFDVLSRLQAQGKIEHIGCSNFNAAQLRLACDVAPVSYVQAAINILGADLDLDMREEVLRRGIGVFAYNVLANGLLTGKFDSLARFPETDRRSRSALFSGFAFEQALGKVSEVVKLAAAAGLTSAQYAIAHIVARPEVVSVVLGVKSERQAVENCAVLGRMVVGHENLVSTGSVDYE
jgi:aryl-alcohol dehydrogenase-like predicted oxidoreductase